MQNGLNHSLNSSFCSRINFPLWSFSVHFEQITHLKDFMGNFSVLCDQLMNRETVFGFFLLLLAIKDNETHRDLVLAGKYLKRQEKKKHCDYTNECYFQHELMVYTKKPRDSECVCSVACCCCCCCFSMPVLISFICWR